jgi:membrane fusion protein (multidrug efflux system)
VVRVTDYQQVHKGDVLVELEDADYNAQVAQATSAAEAAQADIENNRQQRALQGGSLFSKYMPALSRKHQAGENLARVKDNVALGVQSAYNKRERTQRMVRVSEELVTLREEAQRVLQQQSRQGAALPSQVELARAHALEADTALLQSQLAYVESGNEMTVAIGETPPIGELRTNA